MLDKMAGSTTINLALAKIRGSNLLVDVNSKITCIAANLGNLNLSEAFDFPSTPIF